ncbi:hypothetical protein H6P81_017783 [Aristolochia fimbriata]|uniref:MADS-box domain-containing protein n=1 Tax=Aristolochia fimbriata TaxID=158543 RepID=A0AAV7E059_ARIFI|nr:hypothetical protein H6P81_017783 [Aristolochia fimbriata]
MGKRRIEIKKIEEQNNRQVTFSKRRQGLFKKAADFRIRSGVESQMAVVVFSPAGKPFLLADPPGSLDDLIGRFLRETGEAERGRGIWVSDEEEEFDAEELESLVNGLEQLKRIASGFAQ